MQDLCHDEMQVSAEGINKAFAVVRCLQSIPETGLISIFSWDSFDMWSMPPTAADGCYWAFTLTKLYYSNQKSYFAILSSFP